MGSAAADPSALDLGRRQAPACSGIERRAVRVARPRPPGLPLEPRDGRRDAPARAEAGIEEPPRRKPGGGRPVVVEMLRLAPHRPLPGQAEPGEVLVEGPLELGAAARDVDILDPQQEAAAEPAGEALR